MNFDRINTITENRTMDWNENPLPIDEDIRNKKIPLWIRIILYVLLASIVLGIFYMLLHPVNKVKLKFFLTRNCTIEIVASYGFETTRRYVYIDGNVIKIGSECYEIDDGKLYTYIKNSKGEWERILSKENELIENSDIGVQLLKRSNYKRAKGHLFAWSLKKDVDSDIEELSRITFQRDDGKLAIVGYSGVVRVSMRFIKFGKTEITPPWEEG